jgi:hypothetical protein
LSLCGRLKRQIQSGSRPGLLPECGEALYPRKILQYSALEYQCKLLPIFVSPQVQRLFGRWGSWSSRWDDGAVAVVGSHFSRCRYKWNVDYHHRAPLGCPRPLKLDLFSLVIPHTTQSRAHNTPLLHRDIGTVLALRLYHEPTLSLLPNLTIT